MLIKEWIPIIKEWIPIIKEWIPIVRDIFQILFFTVVGIIAVLTYSKAKRTLLQPIRTEVFKEQLKLFSDILRLFSGKGEYELRKDFAFQKVLFVNISALYDDYEALFFNTEIEEDKRPYNIYECPMNHIVQKNIDSVELANDHFLNKSDPRTKTAIWSKYRYGLIRIPKEFLAKEEELRRIMDSPLLPQKVANLLNDYLNLAHANVNHIAELLSECAQEMPQKYLNLDNLRNASFIWIENRYMYKTAKFQLEDKAKEISKYLREYFITERLMERSVR
jgi:hypothetical protein